MPQTTSRHLYWLPEGEAGCEQLALTLEPDSVRALGLVLRGGEDGHFRCRYELEAAHDWRFRTLTISVATPETGAPRRLDLARDADGGWQVDGETAAELEGCDEVDIQVTPFTNSLPIRRLGLGKDESAELRVAYVPLPGLAPYAMAQRYTCLEPLTGAGGRYLYESVESGFRAELPVDADGLVTDYPELFRRQWPR